MHKSALVLAHTEQAQTIFAMYKLAIQTLRSRGIDQWDELYPALSDIEQDIASKSMYVLQSANLEAAVTLNEQQDPSYADVLWRYKEPPVAVIHRLCVHPDAQGSGVGRRMVQQCEALLRHKGYRAVRLDAYAHNPAANALYLSLGYQKVGEVQFRKGRFFLYEKQL